MEHFFLQVVLSWRKNIRKKMGRPRQLNVSNFLAFKCFLMSCGRLRESCNLIGFGRGPNFPVSAIDHSNRANTMEIKKNRKSQLD